MGTKESEARRFGGYVVDENMQRVMIVIGIYAVGF